ncbi:glycosyltransferase family 4 protein [Roseateles amylovorans]|uniref:Glycosyltransferase family 4 protein n=1 Tax=Roseateles amylovorans TaxID=2978473 RepID=A0ABY6AZI2_9BURK|nr:glycosyltransferase family 4 protein [Roseateles amylovorans]UXH76713.1 glycosyltransferase family 4 protein [Roseateles amylovorans]
MKILYHHRTASKDGQAVHIEEMIGSLRALGHEVLVVAPGGESAPEEKSRMGDDVGWVQRLRARLPKWVYELLELGYSLHAYRRLAAAAKGFQPDVIYERYNLYLLAGLMLKRRLGVPLLLEVNAPLADERERFGGLALPRLARWAERRVWRGADAVLPVTQVLGRMIEAQGVPAQRLVVIPNGINEAHFAAAPTPDAAKRALGWEEALVLGFTGFVRDWHGMDRVIRWMASPAAPANARLLLVGDGPARAELEALARELALGERVRFTGVISRDEVPRHVAAFDIALQPAVVAYASPLKLFEYLALAKAIVAPRQPNIEEVLDDDRNALLFDPEQPGALEALLARLAGDEALRLRLGEGAHATIARQHLTWLGNAERVVTLAQSLRAAPRAALGDAKA